MKCSTDATDTLAFTVTGTWNGPGPAPSVVNLLESSLANYAGGGQSGGTLVADSQTASDGLGDSVTPTGPYSGVSQGSHLITVPVQGTSWTFNRTLSATSDCTDTMPAGGGSMSAGVGIGNYSVQVISASLGAHSTVDTSAPGNPWDPAHPRFFSGTNCSATGTAAAVSGYVTHAQLLVGGTDVKDYYDTSFAGHPAAGPNVMLGTSQSSISLTAYFDSTHFPDTNTTTIKMTVSDSGGGSDSYDANVTAKVYNNLYILGDSTMTHGSSSEGDVLGIFSSGNITPNPTTTDAKTAIESNIPTYTDFYSYTHGDPGNFGDCSATSGQTLDLTHYFVANDVTSAVANKTINQPPYNFVFLCACQCAADSTLASGFGITSSSTDRAFLGFVSNADNSSTTQGWAKLIWTDLKAGSTLNKAMVDASATYQPMDQGSLATYTAYGDKGMTVDGTVYSGTTVGQLSR